MRRIAIVALMFVVVGLLLTGCGPHGTKSQQEQQKITNVYSQRLQAAVPYPLAQMRDSEERRNLRERLLRFNDPDKIGYVYLLGFNGNYVGYYTIKGKVTSTGSQMTITKQIVKDCHAGCREVVDSMGDDGSYGPNEGGDAGILFFTTQGVMVESTMDWIYSDAPLPVNAPRLNTSKGPSSRSTYFRK